MKALPTAIAEVVVLEPTVFRDERGYFLESFNQAVFDEAIGRHVDFVQDNHSRSARGVLRGLHYQLAPHAQGKLVRVTSGAAFDVAVDIRRSSPTFGRWVGAELSADNFRQLWIPPGFAHGFVALTDERRLPLQDHRRVGQGLRPRDPLGRPRHRHRLAAAGRHGAARRRQGPRRAAAARRRPVRLISPLPSGKPYS